MTTYVGLTRLWSILAGNFGFGRISPEKLGFDREKWVELIFEIGRDQVYSW